MNTSDRITQINARLLAAGLAPLDSEQRAILSVTPLTQSDREQIEGLFETLCGRCGVDCADLNPLRSPQWSVSDTTHAKSLGTIEFKDNAGEWHNFDVLACPDRLVFGGACNAGFLESGYILRSEDDVASPMHDPLLEELLADLEAYYNDGPQFVSRIVCNERM